MKQWQTLISTHIGEHNNSRHGTQATFNDLRIQQEILPLRSEESQILSLQMQTVFAVLYARLCLLYSDVAEVIQLRYCNGNDTATQCYSILFQRHVYYLYGLTNNYLNFNSRLRFNRCSMPHNTHQSTLHFLLPKTNTVNLNHDLVHVKQIVDCYLLGICVFRSMNVQIHR